MKPMLTLLTVSQNADALLDHYLKSEGVRALTASSCAEARQALRGDGPTILLADEILPDGDGAALCRYVKTEMRLQQIVCALMPARADLDGRSAPDEDADDILPMPCSQREWEFFLRRAQAHLELERIGLEREAAHERAAARLRHDLNNLLFVIIAGAESGMKRLDAPARCGIPGAQEAVSALSRILRAAERIRLAAQTQCVPSHAPSLILETTASESERPEYALPRARRRAA